MAAFQNGCLICGLDLLYSPAAQDVTCVYCHGEFKSDVQCLNGHYICDTCHSLDANQFIFQQCLSTSEKNPLVLAIELMGTPFIKMHGPEHHFLVPAVLLAAYDNCTGQVDLKEKHLQKALSRAAKVPGGFCGSHGSCGAGVGTGIFISVLTGAMPVSGKEWQMANLMTARSLMCIAENGGPRCCKRDSFLAITEAVHFVKEKLDVEMPLTEKVACSFSAMNRECLKTDCQFFIG